MLLADYFKNKGRDPHGLKEKLVELHEKTLNGDTAFGPPPIFAPANEKQDKSADAYGNLSVLVKALNMGDPQPAAQTLGQTSYGSPAQSSQPSAFGVQTSASDINSILVYNIAAMSYQTQQYGQSLLYLKQLLENLDQVEEFIQVKSLFLIMQILFELKMG